MESSQAGLTDGRSDVSPENALPATALGRHPGGNQAGPNTDDLIVERPEGLYCPPGDFHIDPWRPVQRAVITHAHADHASRGHAHYLASAPSEGVLRSRLGAGIAPQALACGETVVHA